MKSLLCRPLNASFDGSAAFKLVDNKTLFYSVINTSIRSLQHVAHLILDSEIIKLALVCWVFIYHPPLKPCRVYKGYAA